MKLSIVTVCFNDLNGLKKTYGSILEVVNIPGDLEFEWVVVDGGSTDGTKDFLLSCKSVSNFVSERDAGIYDAMNKGTMLTKGEYVLYLNAGDMFCNSNSLLQLEKFLDGSDIVLAGANFTCQEEVLRYRKPRPLRSVWHSIPANHQAIAFRKSFLGGTPYNTAYEICGDYELLARLFVEGATSRVVNFPLVSFELGGVSTFSTRLLASEALKVQREVLELPIYLRGLSWVRRKVAMSTNLVICLFKGVRT